MSSDRQRHLTSDGCSYVSILIGKLTEAHLLILPTTSRRPFLRQAGAFEFGTVKTLLAAVGERHEPSLTRCASRVD